MAQFYCSSCGSFYAENGFCPNDGQRLTIQPAAVSSQPETLRASSATGDDGGAAVLASLKRVDPKAEYDKLVGQTLDGRYRIERRIGEGGMGVVFAARHAVIERQLAIKVLKREVARDDATIKRFVQEAKAATRVGHPCIVDVTDFGTTPDGMTYSVMEYVDGQTLSSVVKRSAPLPLARALPIIAQIGRALAAAHDKGIVHRDLKPENVFLVNRDGRRDFVKIVDFGIAKVTPIDGQPADGPRLTRAGSVFGTPEYMAPEQAAGRPDTDKRVDVYALATILYEMLVGKVPHKGDSMVRTLAMQMLDPIVPPSQARPDLKISAELERVVMKGLAKKREDRYPNMNDFITDLERACPDVPTGVPAPRGDTDHGPVQLVPAPPGADPIAMAGLRTISDDSAVQVKNATPTAQTARAEGPRATSKRVADEPRFVTEQKPMTFDHVFTEATEVPRTRSKWPWIVLAIVVAGGGGVALALVMKGSSNSGEVASVKPAVDAGVIDAAPTPVPRPTVDAAVVVDVPVDAGLVDGGTKTVRHPSPPRDAGPAIAKKPKVPADRLTPRGTVQVQVITKPDGASLYVDDSYRGSGNVTLEEDPGASIHVKCTMPGYDPGTVDIKFDGVQDVVLCTPKRTKRCVEGLQNPFDDCPDPGPSK